LVDPTPDGRGSDYLPNRRQTTSMIHKVLQHLVSKLPIANSSAEEILVDFRRVSEVSPSLTAQPPHLLIEKFPVWNFYALNGIP
jgi:hypothetical protein